MNSKVVFLSKYVILVAITSLTLYFFSYGNISDGIYLWAEDGIIFYNQAVDFGLKSIFITYSGYSHLFPRLVALFATNFDISHIPFIFFAGWLFSFFTMILILYILLEKTTGSFFISLCTVFLAIIHPHSGETFFNITNSQWFLGVVFIVLFLFDFSKFNIFYLTILAISGLTSPISFLLMPFLMLCMLIKQDYKINYPKYFLAFVVGLIQAYCLLNSNRIVQNNINIDIYDVFEKIYIFFSFGLDYNFALFPLLLWLVIFKNIAILLYKPKDLLSINTLCMFLLPICLYLIAVFGTLKQLDSMTPTGLGGRYFITSYILIIVAIPLLIKIKRELWISILLFFTICVISLNIHMRLKKDNLDFQSYVWLSKQIDNVMIPINPNLEGHTEWHIGIKNIKQNTSHLANIINVVKNKKIKGQTLYIFLDMWPIATRKKINLEFNIPDECKKSKYIGIVAKMYARYPDWIKIYSKNNKNSILNQMQQRFYNFTTQDIQFSFKNINDNDKILIDFGNKNINIDIKNLNIVCEGLK